MPPDPAALEPITAADALLSWPGYILPLLLVFLSGASFGSFLNVCIYRLPMGLSVNNPKRSFCFRCGTQIRAIDNLPIVSYLLLRGRCRACGQGFSARYMLVELVTGLLFLGLFVRYNPPGSEALAWGVFPLMALTAVLIIGTLTDLDHWIFPTEIAVWGWPVMLLAALPLGWLDPLGLLGSGGPFPAIRVATGTWEDKLIALLGDRTYIALRAEDVLWWEPLANAAIGAILAPAMLYAVGVLGKLLFRREAMGLGDVYLYIFIGAAIGFPNAVLSLMAASILGSVLGTAHIVWRKTRRSAQGRPPLLAGEDAAPAAMETETEDAPLWKRSFDVAHLAPVSGLGRNHLPFIPWIAGGTIIVLFVSPYIMP